ncbi:MAG: formyltetrahydrofolate deformylase [Gammaproteobacteria bacterium]|nr:formyltetrahydrofolate deformylase [Gammaproteobacteria bacterium]
MDTFILTIKCPDRVGIVAAVSKFLADYGGWITEAHHHSDPASGWFFMRQEIRADSLPFSLESFRKKFADIATRFALQWRISESCRPKRVVILASRLDHCLSDIFQRYRSGEYNIEIPCVISNHPQLAEICSWHNTPFHHVAIKANRRQQAFEKIASLLDQAHVDVIVLARYMQIIPPSLCKKYSNQIINIHHGFLPSFSGPKPYHQAFHQGVKIVGATCHYVTEALDAGPIIDQDVVRVSHNHSIDHMVRLGQDIERLVLARGLRYHLEDRILVHENKTIVFN